MNILFLTSYQKPVDGWSVVGQNIVKNIENWHYVSGQYREIFSRLTE